MFFNDTSRNSLDLLRLIAALLVLYSHQFELLGFSQPSFFGINTLGGLGVSIFFFLSGDLVSASWRRDPSAFRFFIRRSLRIFPALWMAILLSVMLLGPLMTSYPLLQYFSSAATWGYLVGIFLLIRFVLPGVFVSNPYPEVVNGSLWTLPVEFLCYLGVGLLGKLRTFSQPLQAIVIILAVVLVDCIPLPTFFARYVTHLEMLAIFWWGVLYGNIRSLVVSNLAVCWKVAPAAFTLLLFLGLGSRGFERTAMLGTVALFVQFAYGMPHGSRLTDALGDLSYGVYIFAFPVQQIMVGVGAKYNWQFTSYLFWSAGIALFFAYLSWHLVEKKALRLKPMRNAMP